MGPLLAFVLALAASHVQVADGSGHQCYVCEPRGGDPTGSLASTFKDQMPVLKCEDFKKDDPRFVKNCPPNNEGCLTQTAGHLITRTCAEYKIHDCQMANGVQYCYCSTPLCNGQSDDPPPDDEPEEDSVEGSATGEDKSRHRGKQQHQHQHQRTTAPTLTATTTHEPHVRGGNATPSAAARTHNAPLFLAAAPLLIVLLGCLRTA